MADLQFQPGRGWYTNSVSVSIGTPTAGATIYYTTNGTVPGPTNGFVYTGPLVFTNTTVLRAAAYRPGYLPALAIAHLRLSGPGGLPNRRRFPDELGSRLDWSGQPVPAIYGCNSNIVNDPQWSNQIPAALLSLPTVSVAMNTDDMFGTNGIYSNPIWREMTGSGLARSNTSARTPSRAFKSTAAFGYTATPAGIRSLHPNIICA